MFRSAFNPPYLLRSQVTTALPPGGWPALTARIEELLRDWLTHQDIAAPSVQVTLVEGSSTAARRLQTVGLAQDLAYQVPETARWQLLRTNREEQALTFSIRRYAEFPPGREGSVGGQC